MPSPASTEVCDPEDIYEVGSYGDSLDDPINEITKVHTITSTATALGYSMCTGTIWTFFMSMALDKDDRNDNEEYSLFGWLFLVTLIIAVIGMPMHLITG